MVAELENIQEIQYLWRVTAMVLFPSVGALHLGYSIYGKVVD
jgi:hypothetical protein